MAALADMPHQLMLLGAQLERLQPAQGQGVMEGQTY